MCLPGGPLSVTEEEEQDKDRPTLGVRMKKDPLITLSGSGGFFLSEKDFQYDHRRHGLHSDAMTDVASE